MLVRLLNAADLGMWMLYLTVFAFADMLRSGSIQTAFIRLVADSTYAFVKGSAWFIALAITMLLIGIFYISLLIFSFSHVFPIPAYYPAILFFVSLPSAMAIWFMQSEGKFNIILYIRLLITLPFLLFNLSGFFFPFSLLEVIEAHVICNALASGIVIVSGWAEIKEIVFINKKSLVSLFRFGKYSVGTLIGANLLKSSDIFMINWFLGPSAVALYTLPYKLIELIEIPIRSFATTAMPLLSQYSARNDIKAVQGVFNRNIGFLILLIIPFAVIGMWLADSILLIIAGESYMGSADIFRCFIFYSLFLPLDRFLGITLDCLNKPYLNFIKVAASVIINVLANVYVLNAFQSPVAVAATTILTIICAVIIGITLLRKIMAVNLVCIFQEGFRTMSQSLHKILPHKV
ncbi:oligosaccharide flippase family protein [Rhodocytophaga rosea]|uniref:oligosaccharide flippase family protein n=1 Tax=Rhodocytophaga rosea TaxID=2704465 RepID=UPI001E615283